MDGDTVLAREERSRARAAGAAGTPGRTSGTVVKVLDRARERVVGRFETQGRREGRPARTTRRSTPSSASRTARRSGAREGEIVEARLTAFPDARRVAHGVVEERLGFLGEPGVDIEIVLRSHNLPPRFPEPVVAEAERVPGGGPHGGPARPARLPRPPDRHDRRRDGQGLRRRGRGRADGRAATASASTSPTSRTTSTEGTALDDEARSRGTSVYFPGPRAADAARSGSRTASARSTRAWTGSSSRRSSSSTRRAASRGSEFAKGVIRSAHRMTYTEVARLLETAADPRRRAAATARSSTTSA